MLILWFSIFCWFCLSIFNESEIYLPNIAANPGKRKGRHKKMSNGMTRSLSFISNVHFYCHITIFLCYSPLIIYLMTISNILYNHPYCLTRKLSYQFCIQAQAFDWQLQRKTNSKLLNSSFIASGLPH